MFKHCPQCTSDQIKFVNQRSWHCPDCDFVYFHNIATAAAAIITYQGKMLFTVRAKEPKKDLLDLPGGFSEPQESLEQSLSREVFEELGLTIINWTYLCALPNTYLYKDINYYTQDCVFTAELTEAPEIIIDPVEIQAVKWLELDEINTHEMAFDSLKNAVTLFISQRKSHAE